jgi:hypothetical protein
MSPIWHSAVLLWFYKAIRLANVAKTRRNLLFFLQMLPEYFLIARLVVLKKLSTFVIGNFTD